MKSISQLLLLFGFLSLFSCSKDNNSTPAVPTGSGSLKIEIEHQYDTSILVLNGVQPYITAAGDSIRLTKLTYYISNIELQKEDNTWIKMDSTFYLVNVDGIDDPLITIPNVPIASYKGVRYLLGIDSTHNVSGAQKGALDPTNGMFWGWNSGYIFMKAEGKTSGNQVFQFHCGGFTGANNALRSVSIDFGTSRANVSSSVIPQVHLMAMVDKLFNNPNQISLSAGKIYHMPGTMTSNMATNAAGMFEFEHVHN
jgi:hypothetical protein